MKNIEDKQLEEKEESDVKYVRDLQEFVDAFFFALINEIYVGVGINLGLSEGEAYKLSKSNPNELQKAGFFKNVFEKFKTVFEYKVSKFRYKKKIYSDGKPMTSDQWDKFNSAIDNYFKEHANKVSEDMAIKSYMLGRETTNFREKKKPYKNKSLFQISEDQFDGKMPDNIATAYKNYDFTNSEKKIINKSYSNIGMYVTQTNDKIQNAIRQNIQIGMDSNKSPVEISSDLYWQIEKNPELNNKFTAEALRKDWGRISATESNVLYEEGLIAPYESKAMESMKEPKKSVYFSRQGGTCDWCKPRQGMIVRLVPAEIVTDQKNESLLSMGIKNDKVTDIAIWTGKSNYGLKLKDLMLVNPAHPWNRATWVPIDPETEWYNPKTGDVEKRQEKKKFVPQMKDYDYRSKEEKKSRKPHYISETKVQFNGNIYEKVSPDEYNKKLEESRKDPRLPIPVNEKNKNDMKIFDEAEKYG